ncbi:MAG: hypothetical protein ACP5NE_00790 [Candidatus Micrarchaeia archaeon]
MKTNVATGYALLAIGIIILFFTFYQAYTIFNELMAGTFPLLAATQNAATQQSTSQNVSVQQVVGNAVSSALAGLHINTYATILILLVVLGLFASIGYKFAKIGVEMLKSTASGQQDKKQK